MRFLLAQWPAALELLHRIPAEDEVKDFLVVYIAQHNRRPPPRLGRGDRTGEQITSRRGRGGRREPKGGNAVNAKPFSRAPREAASDGDFRSQFTPRGRGG